MASNQKKLLPSKLKPLFWSYHFSDLDVEEDKQRIVINVVNYGNWQDWQWLVLQYGKFQLKGIIESTPVSEFQPAALRLAQLLLDIKHMNYASRSDYIRHQKTVA